MIDFIKNLYYIPPTVDFCEKATGGLIQRPFYALSNFAYIIIGLTILFSGKKSRVARAFSSAIVLVGILSLFYDATYSYFFQLLDLAGMFIFATLLVFLNLKRLEVRTHWTIRWIVVALGILVTYFLKGETGNIIFGLLVLFIIISEWFIDEKISKKDWLIGVALFLLGVLIWLPDATLTFCDPNNIFNGRGIYHVISAVAVYFLFGYYSKLKYLAE